MHDARKITGTLGLGSLPAVSGCRSDEPEVRSAASAAEDDVPRVQEEVDPAVTVFFQAASGNIGCSMSQAEAACEIREHTVTAPRIPADCDLDQGTMPSVRGGEPASFLCYGDTAFLGDQTLDGDLGPLRYGTGATKG